MRRTIIRTMRVRDLASAEWKGKIFYSPGQERVMREGANQIIRAVKWDAEPNAIYLAMKDGTTQKVLMNGESKSIETFPYVFRKRITMEYKRSKWD